MLKSTSSLPARRVISDDGPLLQLHSEALDFRAASEWFAPRTPRTTRVRLKRLVEQGQVREVGFGVNDPRRRYYLMA